MRRREVRELVGAAGDGEELLIEAGPQRAQADELEAVGIDSFSGNRTETHGTPSSSPTNCGSRS